jgi:citrate/tricarballylate utilization protein
LAALLERKLRMRLNDVIAEGERIMTICNSCRYCEGYCAVFPAMEQRLEFPKADMNYLANLCHNCAECYYACQYAPPHEFAVNVPQVLAEIRGRSYAQYAWPGFLSRLMKRQHFLGAIFLLSVLFWFAGANTGGETFYDVVPHSVMIGVFGTVSVGILAVVLMGFAAFWRESRLGAAKLADVFAIRRAVWDAMTLRYLDQGGIGCTYPSEQRSLSRRTYHHFTFYGFMLCFASTTVAAIYHYSGYTAPYAYMSAPVVLGTIGGIGLVIGPAGLFAVKRRRDPAIGDPAQDGMDVTFLAMLFLTSITGLLLLALRETDWMGLLLVIHLATVLALFVTLPYGKFVHGVYRFAALIRYALEKQS